MEYITLSNGVQMPTLGYGVFLVSPDECERCVSDAFRSDFRLYSRCIEVLSWATVNNQNILFHTTLFILW